MAGSGRRTHYRKHLTDAVLNDLPEPDEGLGRRIALVVGTRGGNMFDVVVAPLTSSTADVADDEDDARRLSEDGGGVGIPPETTTSDDDGEDDGRIDGSPTTTGHRLPPIRNVRRSSPQLAFLPTKFRKLVWIKRNDFVIVECGDEEEEPIIGQGKSERGERPLSSSSGGGGGGFRYVITNILYKDQVRHIKSRGMWPSDPLFADDVDNHRRPTTAPCVAAGTTAVAGGTRRARSDRGVGVATEETVDDDCRPDDDDDDDDCESPSDDRDGAYEEGGIVFDDPLGGDELASNTNRVAALRVMDDSSSSEEEDSD